MTIKPIAGDLFLVNEAKWNANLAHIEPSHLTARFSVSPGWLLCRPHWCSPEDRDRWLAKVQPTPVRENELSAPVRTRLGAFE